jgi:hypothetical protein
MESCGEVSRLGSDAVVRVIKRNLMGQKVGFARIVVELSLPQLIPLFNFPLLETARKLGISPTALKRQGLFLHGLIHCEVAK